MGVSCRLWASLHGGLARLFSWKISNVDVSRVSLGFHPYSIMFPRENSSSCLPRGYKPGCWCPESRVVGDDWGLDIQLTHAP